MRKIILPSNHPDYKPPVKRRQSQTVWDDTATREYWYERDMWFLNNLFIDEETKKEIRERYNL